MLLADYREVITAEGAILPDKSLKVDELEGVCTVNGLFPMPIVCASEVFPRDRIIDVLDEKGQPLGLLISCKDQAYDIAKFGGAQLSAYLFEVQKDQYGQPGKFSNDYLLVESARRKDYLSNYMESSAFWGRFWHLDGSSLPTPTSVAAGSPIVALAGIRMPTTLHTEAAKRSAMLPYAFERYLKLYHLLELSFDHDTVERIKALGNDLHGIGQILSRHEREEFLRLRQMIAERCSNPGSIAICIEEICRDRRWDGTIHDIFFEFGKEGNPLKEKQTQFEQMLVTAGFTRKGAESSKIISKKSAKKGSAAAVGRPDEFETLMLNVSAYWIYRVRCSIAHNRIGEYVMKPTDEAFVEEFAEKLLRCVLASVLR